MILILRQALHTHDNVSGEEGDRSAKPLTCGFSTARTCALIHWEDDKRPLQPWCHREATKEGKY